MAIFAIFCVAPCITACCSDNIDASVLPNNSFEPILPIFLGKHAKTGDTFRSHLPLKSLYPELCRPKKLFWEHFSGNIIFLSHFNQMNTPKCYTWSESYESHLSRDIFRLFFDTTKGQIFCDTLNSFVLRPCHIPIAL